MKKIINSPLFTFILGGIIFGSVGIYAASYVASDISYTKDGKQTTVSDALDNLYNKNSIGDAEASNILLGKTALVQGSLLTGTMPDNGAWTNTPTESGKVTIPEGYHDGNGYVDTATAYTNGYNAGVAAADARANSSSANYQAGYNAGVAAALDKTGTATATLSKDYLDEGSTSKYVITVSVGSYKNSKTLYWGANSDRSDSVAVNFKLQ